MCGPGCSLLETEPVNVWSGSPVCKVGTVSVVAIVVVVVVGPVTAWLGSDATGV